MTTLFFRLYYLSWWASDRTAPRRKKTSGLQLQLHAGLSACTRAYPLSKEQRCKIYPTVSSPENNNVFVSLAIVILLLRHGQRAPRRGGYRHERISQRGTYKYHTRSTEQKHYKERAKNDRSGDWPISL